MFQSFFKSIFRLIKTFQREFLFVFRIAPKRVMGLTVFQVLIGVIPAIELYVAAKIIDELVLLIGGGVWSDALFHYALIVLCLLGLQRLVFAVNDYLTEHLRNSFAMEASDRIHRKMLELDAPLLERPDVHTLIVYLKEQTWRPLQMVYSVFQALGNITASISYIVLAIAFSPFLTLLFLLAVMPSLVISVWAVYSGSEIAFGKASYQKKVWYFESLFRTRRSLIELTVHNIGHHIANQYREVYEKMIDKEMSIERRKLGGSLVANVGAFVVYAFVYFRIITSVVGGVLSIGQFALYVGAFMNLERFMVSQVWQLALLLEHTKYLDAFRDLEELEPSIRDEKDAVELSVIDSIEFVGVSYRYPSEDRNALSSVSFTMKKGDKTALVGENGAGKSTLVKLLLRLYEPTSGEILINGRDYRGYSLVSLRKQIGVTFQDFLQFSLSVHENIAFGEMKYLNNRPVVQESAVRAGVHDRVLRLESGYDTFLGQEFHTDGVDLSGGEWQKIALARSLIKDASMLVLDEPTAALDARSEYHFFKELFNKTENQMLFVISHRFSSVRIADRILVLLDGEIVEQGTHKKLMALKGLYHELYSIQTREID